MKKKTTSDLREALRSGVVEFTFTKQNGETRKAKGTTNSEFIPKEYHSKGSSRKLSGVVTYFDVEVNGYRNVSEDAEVKF